MASVSAAPAAPMVDPIPSVNDDLIQLICSAYEESFESVNSSSPSPRTKRVIQLAVEFVLRLRAGEATPDPEYPGHWRLVLPGGRMVDGAMMFHPSTGKLAYIAYQSVFCRVTGLTYSPVPLRRDDVTEDVLVRWAVPDGADPVTAVRRPKKRICAFTLVEMGLRMRAMEQRVRQLEECLESAKRALQESDEFPEKLSGAPQAGERGALEARRRGAPEARRRAGGELAGDELPESVQKCVDCKGGHSSKPLLGPE